MRQLFFFILAGAFLLPARQVIAPATPGEAVNSLVLNSAPFNSKVAHTGGSGSAKAIMLSFSENPDKGRYPVYNIDTVAPDKSGVESSATELAAKIRLGWNLGNALEANGGETGWGNPPATPEMIDLVRQSGFNAIRIPCSWNQHMEDKTTAKIRGLRGSNTLPGRPSKTESSPFTGTTGAHAVTDAPFLTGKTPPCLINRPSTPFSGVLKGELTGVLHLPQFSRTLYHGFSRQ